MLILSALRRVAGGYSHWCPGCEQMHVLPESGWAFDGNLESPSFTPSFRHTGVLRIFQDGEWTGEWKQDLDGSPIAFVCHYILTAGVLHFCGDCTHALAGTPTPLPKRAQRFSN